jgi:anti-sigma factor RsiW
MTSCRETVGRLLDLLAGELPGDHRDQAERHLAECPCCAAFLDSYRMTVLLVRRLARPPLPAGLELRLRALLADGAARGSDGTG